VHIAKHLVVFEDVMVQKTFEDALPYRGQRLLAEQSNPETDFVYFEKLHEPFDKTSDDHPNRNIVPIKNG